MSGSLNEATLIGNLVRDPEVRTLGSGDKVVNLRLATSETWRDRSTGERKEKTEYHAIVIFNENLGKVAENYLKKGSKIFVRGALQTRKWTDQSGAEKYSTEVVLQKFRGELTILDSRQSGDEQRGGGGSDDDFRGAATRGVSGRGSGPRESFAADLDDEIPFASRWGLL